MTPTNSPISNLHRLIGNVWCIYDMSVIVAWGGKDEYTCLDCFASLTDTYAVVMEFLLNYFPVEIFVE